MRQLMGGKKVKKKKGEGNARAQIVFSITDAARKRFSKQSTLVTVAKKKGEKENPLVFTCVG